MFVDASLVAAGLRTFLPECSPYLDPRPPPPRDSMGDTIECPFCGPVPGTDEHGILLVGYLRGKCWFRWGQR